MATPTPEVSLWATLLPVIVGGLIGLTGGLAGPWFLETRKQAAEKKKKRAEKFEELIAAIHEHSHWLDTARSIRVLGIEKELGVNPVTKALAIVTIYFPEFYDEMKEVDLAQVNLRRGCLKRDKSGWTELRISATVILMRTTPTRGSA